MDVIGNFVEDTSLKSELNAETDDVGSLVEDTSLKSALNAETDNVGSLDNLKSSHFQLLVLGGNYVVAKYLIALLVSIL